MNGLISAWRTLTCLPIPGRDAERFCCALPYFPLVGLGLGAGLWGLAELGRLLPAWPAGVASLLVLANALLTRGLHLDGLGDWADAQGALVDRARRLEIMKDPRLGSFGVLAVVAALALRGVAYERLWSQNAMLWLLPIGVAARVLLVEATVANPYARATGGTARGFVEGAGPRHRWAAWLIAVVVLAPFAHWPWAGVLLAAAAAAWLWGWWCRRTFGGITGDLLGAGLEMFEVTALLVVAWMSR